MFNGAVDIKSEEKNQLEAIIKSVANGLIIIQKDKSITFLNEEAKNIFYKPEEIKSLGDSFRYTSYFRIDNTKLSFDDFPYEKILQGSFIRNVQIKALRPDKTVYFLLSCSPICNSTGNMDYILLSLFDNTEKIEHRNRQIKAIHNEKSALVAAIEMKDEFLSIVSHEFKTPLTVINSALQMMDIYKNKGEFEKALKFTDSIKRNIFRQLRLVNNLLDITKSNAQCLKINKSNYDIVFLTSSITQNVMDYARQKEVNLSFNTNVKSCFLGIDEEKYERILLNLLSNAIKFTPKGKNIFVNVYKENEKINIQVKDTGIGIPKDKQIIIFQRFGQVNSSLSRCAEGTGIGLSLVKLLIKQLGGKIFLESTEGIGSSFTLVFPISIAEDSHSEPTATDLNNTIIQSIKIEFSDIYLP